MASVTFTFDAGTRMHQALHDLAELVSEHDFESGVMVSLVPLGGGSWQADVTHTDEALARMADLSDV
jgi:hypothetical protein